MPDAVQSYPCKPHMDYALKLPVIGAWLAFLLCLLLPAFCSADGKDCTMGWQAGALAVQSITRYCENRDVFTAWLGCANVAMLILPLSLGWRSVVIDSGILVLLLPASLLAFQLSFSTSEWGAGFYIWVASYFLASVAFVLRVSRRVRGLVS